MQARYTKQWLKSTGSALDHDGTNGWGFVVDVALTLGPSKVYVISWPLAGIERPVLASNLEYRIQTKDGWGPVKAFKGAK